MVTLRTGFLMVFLVIMFGHVPSIWGQTVRAYVDRNPISVDETVRLIVEQQGSSSGDDPDHSLLKKDFDILGTSQSSQTSIINGQTSELRQWVTTLAPKRDGRITIPPITVGNQQSEALVLMVQQPSQGTSGAAEKDIFLEATVEPQEPYVQSQIVYTLRLYHAVSILEGKIEDPQISQAVVERVGEDRSFDTVRNGRRYQVVERRYLVVPQASGSLKIPSVLFSGKIPDGRRSQSMFDDMFGNGLGSLGRRFQSAKLVRARSQEMTLKIQEIPSGMNSDTWLPAREFTLTETWSIDPLEVQVGEPVTRTVTMHAKGLTGEQLPELPLSGNDHVKVYPDQPTITTEFDGSWAVGRREQKLALVPTNPGHLTIPEIRIQWWNLEENRTEEAVLSARDVMVQGTSSFPNKPAAIDHNVNSGLSQAVSPSLSTGSNSSLQKEPENSFSSPMIGQWPAMTSFMFALWLLTVVGWWYDRRKSRANWKTSTPRVGEQEHRSLREAREAVKKACLENSPDRTREALLKWASVKWENQGQHNLGSIARKLSTQQQNPRDAQQAIWDLDRNLYAAQREEWDGKKFWNTIAPAIQSLEKKNGTGASQRTQDLAPLYLHSST
ncbi:BatD family protein [Candidatus Nitrospira salsa]